MSKDMKDKGLEFVLRYYEQGKIDTKRALCKVKARTGLPVARTVTMYRRVAIAASLLVLLAVGATYFYMSSERETLLAAGDSTQTFILSDQTRVTLSPHSTLAYKKASPRSVTLHGNAFFEVTHDEQHPFTVTNELSLVRVLGTRFMVSSQTDVYVVEGKVGFSSKDNEAERLVLTRGMKARLEEGEQKPRLVAAGSVNQTAWATGVFHFYNTPIDSVLHDLSLFYAVPLHCDNAAKRLSGDFTAESSRQNLNEIISLIEHTLGVDITINE